MSKTDPDVAASPSRFPKLGEMGGRIWAGLFSPVDIAFLVYFRIGFGGIMLWEAYRYLSKGWVKRYYIDPQFFFGYYGFEWVKPWPGDWMYVHFYALGALAVCIIVGLYYRIAATLFFLGFTYVFLLDQTRYLNHFYLISLVSLLMIFVPAERALSLDWWRKPSLRSDTVPGWVLWLLRGQIGIAYFYGGVAKLNGDWLRGEPMRMWLSRRTDFPVIGQYFTEEWMVYGFVIGGLLLDLLVVPLLLWRRTRLYAYGAALLFHLLNARLFNIGVFPWFMIAATLIYFPPDIFRRVAAALWKGAAVVRPATATSQGAVSSFRGASLRDRTTGTLVIAYLVVQCLVPLRHFLYPGDVNWTEEGHLFSWHMKLREKRASATFIVKDPDSGKTWRTRPSRYLKSRQRSKMSARPDMIIQFAHFLAEQKRKEGYPNAEVRVRARASVNGRERQLLVDPKVDLAKERRSLWPARWIRPLTEPLRRAPVEPTAGEPDVE